ncbi:diguanylate cyclase (GGDEF) domain-containing protein [Treponema sp. JC4]|uniref:GGDEF domain-containing protein n=1 Tax=Treponema sp. JC4 TaxID=1124982 RepID=UPI00025AFB4E|nr:GGDEF domain-containing protein [Treponema sp. JC4]EID86307.1 diguanylate cyclase (GGDEF) domain-containing protein [Treponema sp. JC4]
MARNKFRVALIVDFISIEYSQRLFESVNEVCKEYDYELLVFPIGTLHSVRTAFGYQAVAIASLITKNSIDGIIFSTGVQLHFVTKSEILSYIKGFNPIPVVSVAIDIPGCPSITSDPYYAYKAIIDNLIDVQGCKKLAILGLRSSSSEIRIRRNTVNQILEEKNFPPENYTYFRMSFDYLTILKDLETYAISNDGKIEFDAIIAFNDEMAYAASEFVKRHGLRIPEDVQIVGFDDLEQSKYTNPSITSVNQHIDEHGRRAVKMLKKIFEDEEFERNVVLINSAVFRESTCRLPYPEELENTKYVDIQLDAEKVWNARNLLSGLYMRNAQIQKVINYYSETQFDMSVDQLKSRLNSDLRDFGIKAAAVVVYEAPIEQTIPFDYFNLPHRASLFCGFDESTGYDSEILPERIKFNPNERILPDGIINFSESGTICMSLYHNTLHYGYIVFRIENHDDSFVYDFIIKIVSSLVSSIFSYAEVSSEKNKFHKKFKELDAVANTDELTGLYNRRGLFDFGKTTLQFAKAMNQSGMIIYCDMDGLKKINDTFGHEAGDCAIIAESIILKGNFRSNDIVARIGGDEFVIISPGMKEETFRRIQDAIHEDCRLWTEKNNSKFKLSISMGYVKFPSEKVGYQITPLLSEADANLYVAKRDKKR